ncbi:MAG TPA: sigma-70 family RNA polymerase sigma factor [bacterium]|nr:sigma-70 family RNA polymerase sigma factor [bacterium]
MDDGQLVAQAQAGDLSAFDELVRRHHVSVYCYLYRTCRNGAEAEEMTQVAFVKAWEALRGFRGQASFKTWLFRIATNLCINRLSRRKPSDPVSEEIPAPRRDEPEEALRQRLLSERIGRALEALPADQRSALVLSIYEEMSHEEIAAAMGRSPASVNSLLYRARIGVRRALEDVHARDLTRTSAIDNRESCVYECEEHEV